MAVTIRVDLTNPRFLGLSPDKIRFTIGPQEGVISFPWSSPDIPTTAKEIGQAGSNRAILDLSGARPIQFAFNDDFLFLGNADTDAFQANRTKAQLVLMMRKGYIIVEKDGVPLLPADVATFVP